MFAFSIPGPSELAIITCLLAFIVVPFWIIASKAGFPGWIALVILIPVLNIVFLFFLAFAPWPSLRDHDKTTAKNP